MMRLDAVSINNQNWSLAKCAILFSPFASPHCSRPAIARAPNPRTTAIISQTRTTASNLNHLCLRWGVGRGTNGTLFQLPQVLPRIDECAQHGVDTGLIGSTGLFEEYQHVGIDAHARSGCAFRRLDAGVCPVDIHTGPNFVKKALRLAGLRLGCIPVGNDRFSVGFGIGFR